MTSRIFVVAETTRGGHPGELCQRMLVRMAHGLGRLGAEADQNTSPLVATAYFAADLLPTLSSTHTVLPRYRHEFVTLPAVIVQLALGENFSAMGTLGQRPKALETAVVDGGLWGAAKWMELVAGGATLAEGYDTDVWRRELLTASRTATIREKIRRRGRNKKDMDPK